MKQPRADHTVRCLATAVVLGLTLLLSGGAAAQESVTINFEGLGDQPGSGDTDFSFMGSNWSGGEVETQGLAQLYSSGAFAYHPEPNATVTFDEPIDRVEFFWVHGGSAAPGTATAFNGSGDMLGSVDSNEATFFNDPANFETFDPSDAIARIEFSNGVIDDFTFVTGGSTAAPGNLSLVASNFGVGEGGGAVTVRVQRNNGSDGAVSVNYSTNDGAATAPADYRSASGTLNWVDGDGSAKSFQVQIVDDGEAEPQERFNVRLTNPTGGAGLGRDRATVTINDNDEGGDDGGDDGGSGLPGDLQFQQELYEVDESAGGVMVHVERVGGSAGSVSAEVIATGGTATEDADFLPVTETVTFGAGDTSSKSVMIPIFNDGEDEGVETIHVELSGPGGGAVLGDPDATDVAILDDEGLDDCDAEDPRTLCLGQGGRFKVQVSFRNRVPGGGTTTDRGQALPLIREVDGEIRPVVDSGLFTFFDPDNAELLVKVLPFCFPPIDHFAVFYGATTNVEFTLTVTDTQQGEVFFRSNPLGQAAEPVLATNALDTCP